ncbi:MAG TPA: TerC family protein, partial [Phycisphaerales bacterium]|nr:TerC family protein [Phycisphaerales bacterium]
MTDTASTISGVAPLMSVATLIALLTLTALEIVLGIDNVVFIAILSNAVSASKRSLARRLGLVLAMLTRVLLLLGISWVMGLTATLFEVPFLRDGLGEDGGVLGISGRDLLLLLGGVFLIGKATWEIRHQVVGHRSRHTAARVGASFGLVVSQIVLIDMVFSLDSVITAVGMVDRIEVMIAAVVLSSLVMIAMADAISGFIERHPSIKILALAFLVLIGVLLVADGMHQHVSRGYVYFAMAFALVVDL